MMSSHSPSPPRPPWVTDHDNRLSFVVPYLLLSIVLGVFVSLFWLIVLIGVHAVLEWHTQRARHPAPGPAAMRVLWELKLDIALVLAALVIVVYIEQVLAVLGLGGAAQAGAASAARIAAWQRSVRGVLLTVDEAAIGLRSFLRIFQRRKTGKALASVGPESTCSASPSETGPAEAQQTLRNADVADCGEGAMEVASGECVSGLPAHEMRPWRFGLKWGDRLSLLLVLLMAFLLISAPLITDKDVATLWQATLEELQPFPR